MVNKDEYIVHTPLNHSAFITQLPKSVPVRSGFSTGSSSIKSSVYL